MAYSEAWRSDPALELCTQVRLGRHRVIATQSQLWPPLITHSHYPAAKGGGGDFYQHITFSVVVTPGQPAAWGQNFQVATGDC